MPYVTRDDLSLYYEREGEGDPPLVFVHGWCCDHTFFRPQFDYFRSSHQVLTFDLRGCGSSDRPADGYDVPNLADDLAWLCAETGIEKPVVIGHSLGAMIAIELAARHPKLPLMVVADESGPINPLPETRLVYEGFSAQLEGAGAEAVRRAWVEADLADDPVLSSRIVETMCSVPLSVAAAVIQGVNAWNGVAALALCQVPLLLLSSATGGSNDPARLRPLKPDLHVGVTVGAGHFNQLEVPQQVTAMIERFLHVASPASDSQLT